MTQRHSYSFNLAGIVGASWNRPDFKSVYTGGR